MLIDPPLDEEFISWFFGVRSSCLFEALLESAMCCIAIVIMGTCLPYFKSALFVIIYSSSQCAQLCYDNERPMTHR